MIDFASKSSSNQIQQIKLRSFTSNGGLFPRRTHPFEGNSKEMQKK